MKRTVTFLFTLMLLTLGWASVVSAGSGSGITLSYPDNMVACEPTFVISTSGVPDSFTTQYNLFIQAEDGTLVQIDSGTSQGNLNITYTPEALGPDTSQTFAVFVAVFNADGVLKEKLSGKWTVTCEAKDPDPDPDPDPEPFQGCTPGYWRQSHHFDSWIPTGYAPGDSYNTTFAVNGSFDTLLDAVWARGGQERALARHAVAALLNAAHPDINYAYTVDEILAGVQAAYASGDFNPFKDALDTANNAGCDLN